jgi:tetratricopeptide (TPR) repeat protein
MNKKEYKKGVNMKNKNSCSMILLYLAFFSLVFFMPVNSYSYELFHTIQVSSFKTVTSAEKQYDEIVETLNEEDLDNLRVEKIGKFYSVRVGKFNNSNDAKKSLKKIRSSLPQAAVMTAYIKDERIVSIYERPAGAVVKDEVQQKPVSILVPDKTVPVIAEKIAEREEFYTVQISSFKNVTSAQKQYDEIVETLNEEDLDNLRVEKIGKFYSVRVGKFNNSSDAKKSLEKIRSSQPQATVMTAYFKDERIIRIYESQAVAVVEEEVQEKPVSVSVPDKTAPEVAKKIKPQEKPVSIPVREDTVPVVTEKIAKKEEPRSLKEITFTISSLVEKNDFNSALEMIKKEIAAKPEHPDLNAWHGMVLLKMDRPLEAMKYLRKATELSPEVSDYHNALAYSLYFLKKYDGAVDAFNKAINLEPVHVDALTGLCIVYTAKGEKEKATEIFNKIKDVDRETSDKLLKMIGT